MRKTDSEGNVFWVPDRVPSGHRPDEPGLASQGYVGIFGFYSTLKGDVPGTAYLPRVAGVPLFFKEIESMALSEEVAGQIDAMTVIAVMINPLQIDGDGSTEQDVRRGDSPGFLVEAIQRQSMVRVDLVRNGDGKIEVTDVRSLTVKDEDDNDVLVPIYWNLLIGEDVAQSDAAGFHGRMESIGFRVSYDSTNRRILLNVLPKSSAKLLGRSCRLEEKANSNLVLAGFGADPAGTPLYGFETLWFPSVDSEGNQRLPLMVSKPFQQFGSEDIPHKLTCDGLGDSGDVITISRSQDEMVDQICWWDSTTGLSRKKFETKKLVSDLAYGRSIVENAWVASIATCSDSEDLIDLYHLASGSLLQQFQAAARVSAVAFAKDELDTYLIAASEATIQVWRMSDATIVETFDHSSVVSEIVVCDSFAVVRGVTGLTFWRVGKHATEHFEFATDKPFTDVSLLRWPNGQWGVVGTDDKNDVTIYFLVYRNDEWQSDEFVSFSLGSNRKIRMIDLISVATRPHLCAAVFDKEEKLQEIEVWVLPRETESQAVRWRLDFSTHRLRDALFSCSPESDGLQLTVTGVGQSNMVEISRWNLNQLLRLDQHGNVEALLDVDIGLSPDEIGFAITGQVLPEGNFRLVKRDLADAWNAQAMRPGTARQGMYCFISDLDRPDNDSGATAVVLWQELKRIAGTTVQSKRIHRDLFPLVLYSVADEPYTINTTVDWTIQTNRLFGMGVANQTETLAGGRILGKINGQSIEIHLTDQSLTVDKDGKTSLLGLLLWKDGDHKVQGPVVCHYFGPDHAKGERIELVNGIFLATPKRFAKETMKAEVIKVDYATAVGNQLDYYDLAVPLPVPDVQATFLHLSGSAKGLQWKSVGSDRIPVDLCLDNEVRKPLLVLPSSVQQLNHQQGLGRRIRFQCNQGSMFNDHQPGDAWQTDSNDPIWILQPLLVSASGVMHLLDAGVVAMVVKPLGKYPLRTENLLSIVRPAKSEVSTVTCLVNTTAPSASSQ